jgi:hypothetical protein
MLPTADSETLVIVGFDGSAASKRALGLAAVGLRGHSGRIEVVFVSPAGGAGEFRDHPAARARAEVTSRDAAGLEVQTHSAVVRLIGISPVPVLVTP